MSARAMPALHINGFTASTPIIQGGMGVGVSLSGLASAVANQGGIGVIAAAGIGMTEPDFDTRYRDANKRALQREIRLAKEKSDGIIGVNIMIALSDHETLLIAALEAGTDLVFMGAGLPLKIPGLLAKYDRLKDADRIIPIVSSGRAAGVILKSWAKSGVKPGAIVVEGPKAGGHLGFRKEQLDNPAFGLETLVTDTLTVVAQYSDQGADPIPVIAAGGIFCGADIYRFLNLGASGVQMATRFVATEECDAALPFKQTYVRAKEEDITIIDSPVGLPGRAIDNHFLQNVSCGENQPFKCPWKCLRTCDFRQAPYCIGLALTQAKQGFLDRGFAFAGSNAWRITEIETVSSIIESLKIEYEEAVVKAVA